MRSTWYSNVYVLYKLSRILKGRETSFIGDSYPVRCIKAHNSSYLKTNMDKFNFINRNYNLYHSVSNLFNMPLFTYNNVERKKQQFKFFTTYHNFVTSYDFVIDLDAVDLSDALEDAKVLASYLIAKKVKFAVIFSGKKGFHFEVKNIKYSDGIKPDDMVDICKKIASNIKNVLKLKSIDIGIYDLPRIWKVPFSIDYRTGYVVLPLTIAELYNFKLDIVDPNKIINVINERKYYTTDGDVQNILKIGEF